MLDLDPPTLGDTEVWRRRRGHLAVLSPVVIGFLLGPKALGGMLGGALICCVMMALMMSNAGGAWDNAKKYVEKGNLGGKGSDVHKAVVVGDTVGDPLKDTSGPSMNILIKLTCLIGLVIAPILGGHSNLESHLTSDTISNEVQVLVNTISSDDNQNVTGEVRVITNVDGLETVTEATLNGSEDEVNKAVQEVVNEAKKK